MKKHNLSEFFKSKSFYVLLCVGALAIVVIAMVGLRQSSENENNDNLVDLNEPISEVVDEGKNQNHTETEPDHDNEPPSSVTNNNDGNDEMDVAQGDTENDEPVTDGSLLEYDAYEDPNQTVDNTVDSNEEDQVDEPTEVQEVMQPATLHFNHENDKLLWPVSGNVIMKYSMDRLVHHATLQQWKVSPAMLISAEEGEDVSSVADGIITEIVEDDETGLTITASIGDDYSVVYGQLGDLTVEEGERIEKGQILGSINKPTKYYSVEGPNLYFQLLQEDKTLDPMVCLE
jgi:murein DD-endopeptidase MepM/ murein hydrolase activator NlpD